MSTDITEQAPIFGDFEEEQALGVVKGPSEEGSRYVFITSDNRRSKIGEFIHYYPHNDPDAFPIYGKIVSRKLARSYPAGLLADPNIELRKLAFVLGADGDGDEIYEVEAQILGSWNYNMNCFVNPRLTPDPGDPVFLTADLELASVLSPCGKGQVGSAHLGHLLTREEGRVPVVLRVREMVSTHLAILAGTGSGKSYTAAVLVEEMLKHYNRAAVLIADPHGEYSTLQELEENVEFGTDNYQPKVQIKPPESIRIRLSSLRESDLRYLLPGLTEKQSHFLGEAYRKVVGSKKDDGGKQWGLADLKQALLSLAPDGSGENFSTINALMWKIDMRFGRSKELFSDAQHIPLRELFAPGQCTVLQMSEIDAEDQQIILGTLLRRAFYSRMNAVKDLNQHRQEALDFPVFILIEEAHRFAPAGGHAITTNILKTILSEGRKFGVGIGVISQRPGKLDSDVLSQCMTQLFMRIVNPIDQRSIAESVESAGRDLLSELPSLTRGQVIVAGNAIHTPVLCKVRTRHTPHGGETLDAPQEWLHYFSSSSQEKRRLSNATVPDSKPKKRRKGRVV
ncbi:MAG TPA: hypothetical protein DCE42_04775 [Myxococcales bacterium]|nr:hypothetical protein [Deltaproteobacteria bacterium]MBU53606.1 hypothetical protein [Deltaproteobacteria bacterium]HAA54043.1 hypothetical protein [Myxococcales bacterium]|tara:strand:- start:8337 stop:10037 length:1701 start_codon:yes stop_codon:yes gene_type:complete